MNIYFTAKTNKDYVMINSATFRLKTGTEIVIDRKETYYDIDDNFNLDMEWSGCYLWAIDGNYIYDKEYLLNDDAIELLKTAELVSLDLEDDADSDYKVTDIKWEV